MGGFERLHAIVFRLFQFSIPINHGLHMKKPINLVSYPKELLFDWLEFSRFRPMNQRIPRGTCKSPKTLIPMSPRNGYNPSYRRHWYDQNYL